MTDNQGNKDTFRSFRNYFEYTGSGNYTNFIDTFNSSNVNMQLRHKWNAFIGADDDTYSNLGMPGTVYVLNYRVLYEALDYALACYNELTANEWMYTEESVSRAKATIISERQLPCLAISTATTIRMKV